MERVPIPRRIWYAVIMSYISGILITAGALVYMNYVDTQSNQRWCIAVIAIDDAFKQATTTSQSPAAKRIAEAYSKLRNDFNC